MGLWVIDTPFGFSLDLTLWQSILMLREWELVKVLFAIGGWTAAWLLFFFIGKECWLAFRQAKYTKGWEWVLLAVDIPPMFIQTPKAVEQIFAHLSGIQSTPNFGEKYWQGEKQRYFSLEIVSIEGYIQFLIRTEKSLRDLVEAAIYAQYPEAEITEVEDYVDVLPKTYPNPEYDIAAGEFKLINDEPFPIRTYPSFEYSLSKDVVFSDPMAALLENFSRIGHGENFWMQIIIEPTDNAWKQKGIDLVKKIVANKKEVKPVPLVAKATEGLVGEAVNIIKWSFDGGDEPKKEEPAGKVQDLTPGAKNTVESIEDKISKIGFKTKLRVLYIAKKETFNPTKCMKGFVGALYQFNINVRNGFKGHKSTSGTYWFKEYKIRELKRKFAEAVRKRKIKTFGNPYILNIEELATIWHFPLPFVKTPLMQKQISKTAEPPLGLPIETMDGPLKKKVTPPPEGPTKPLEPSTPEDLPYG